MTVASVGLAPRERSWWLYVLLVAAHAALLFVVIPAVSSSLSPFYNQNLYADGYDLLAANLAAGHGYRFYPDTATTLMREPGYPIFLAGIFRLFGENFMVVKIANLCLVLGTAWLLMGLARRFSSSPILILGASLLFLFHPGVLVAESRGGVEALFTFLLTLFLVTLYRASERRRYLDYAASGLVLGLTVLVRSTPMLFPFGLLAYLVAFDRQGQSVVSIGARIAVMVAVMMAVLSPWIVRNYRLTGKFVPTASVLGVSAHAGQYISRNLTADSRWVELDRAAAAERMTIAHQLGYPFKDVTDGYYQFFYSSSDELRFSSDLLSRVTAEYRRSPGLFVRCAGANLFNIWFAGKTWKSTALNLVVQLPYLVLALVGAVIAIRRRQLALVAPLALFLLYYVAVYAPILAQARYSVPVVPLLSVLAGVALAAAGARFGEPSGSPRRGEA